MAGTGAIADAAYLAPGERIVTKTEERRVIVASSVGTVFVTTRRGALACGGASRWQAMSRRTTIPARFTIRFYNSAAA